MLTIDNYNKVLKIYNFSPPGLDFPVHKKWLVEITLDVLYNLSQNPHNYWISYCSWVEIYPYKKKQ